MSSVDYDKAMPKPRLRKAVVDDMPSIPESIVEPIIEEPIVNEKPKSEWKLKVVALRKGFYKNVRYDVGARFTLAKAEQYGSWMKKILE